MCRSSTKGWLRRSDSTIRPVPLKVADVRPCCHTPGYHRRYVLTGYSILFALLGFSAMTTSPPHLPRLQPRASHSHK